jgi:heat shock protein HslJ
MSYRVVVAATLVLTACAGGGGGGTAGETDPASGGWVEVKSAAEGTGQAVSISGTVRHLDLEGGIYVIEDATGTRYNPTNLPEEFRTDGKAVEAEGTRRDDMVSIGMVGPMVELRRIRERAGGGEAGEGAAPSEGGSDLAGSSWLLEDLAGAGVIDDARASLEFTEAGRVSGSATCNRFNGSVTMTGDSISFGPLASTRKACPEALMNQESKYLAALGAAERFEVKDSFLHIHTAGGSAPLRFVRE